MEDGYQNIFEYDREYSSHSEMDNEALYTDIEVYNEALGEGIETVDETQLEDTNEEICDSDRDGITAANIILLKKIYTPTYYFTRNESDLTSPEPLSFQQLTRFRQMPNIEQLQVEEFVSRLKNFIEEAKNDLFSTQNNAESILIRDPLHVPHKGRQPNRYKSAPANDGEEMRHDIQNTTGTSSDRQVSALQDSEKK
ncbi:3782_t:CDS:2, partial [Gigaspora margarita]